jgi:hypothetical protein
MEAELRIIADLSHFEALLRIIAGLIRRGIVKNNFLPPPPLKHCYK